VQFRVLRLPLLFTIRKTEQLNAEVHSRRTEQPQKSNGSIEKL
jgi:hypothetical protein